MDRENNVQSESTEYLVYTSRIWAIAMFSFLNLSNSMLWVSFAPISNLSASYFGEVVGNDTYINLLAVVFQILYGPGTILGAVSMKLYGLRTTMLIGGCYH